MALKSRRTSCEAADLLVVLTRYRQETGILHVQQTSRERVSRTDGYCRTRACHTFGHDGAHLHGDAHLGVVHICAWWCTSVIPVLRRWSIKKVEEHQEVRIIPKYVTNPRPSQHCGRSCSKTAKTEISPIRMQKTGTRGTKILQIPETEPGKHV